MKLASRNKTRRIKTVKPRSPKLPRPDPTSTVLVIRNSKHDRSSNSLRIRNGQQVTEKPFIWPTSGPVECDDWDPDPKRNCGGGLHGLLWGDGSWGLLNSDSDAVWQVIKVQIGNVVATNPDTGEWQATDNIVRRTDKVRFHKGEVIYSGGMADAVAMVLADKWHIGDIINTTTAQAKKAKRYSSKAASSGYSSKAASSGNSSKAASSGYSSKAASSGDSSTAASSGYSSKAASSGYSSKAASSGYSSKAASSGNYSTAASSGKDTISMAAGRGCVVSAGENGCFASVWYDEATKRNRIVVGYVGENGIKPETRYRLNQKGEWIEA